MMGLKLILSLVLLVGLPMDSEAFAIGPSPYIRPIPGTGIPTARTVVIFPGDDYFEEEEEDFNGYGRYLDNTVSYSSQLGRNPVHTLWERLSSQKYMDRLVRLACAFAPHYRFRPQDLEGAHIMDVDAGHIEISAVLCEDTGCVQVPVPVQFPKYCGAAANVEECVLDNIEILDAQAYQLISEEERKEYYAEDLEDQRQFAHALQEIPSTLPAWWTYPERAANFEFELSQDCWYMKDLLNEPEFEPELVALVRRQLHLEGKENANNVVQASAAVIGPSGMILRGLLVDHEDGSVPMRRRRFSTVEVPIRFDREARCREELRESVLGLVSTTQESDHPRDSAWSSPRNSTSIWDSMKSAQP